MKQITLTLALLLISCSQLSARQTLITGHLFGHDGRVMPKSRIYLFESPSFIPLATADVAGDGSFSFQGKYSGILRLKFTGANHREFSMPLLLETYRDVKITVRLAEAPSIIEYDEAGNPLPSADAADSMAVVVYPDRETDRVTAIIARMDERQRIGERRIAMALSRGESPGSLVWDWSKDITELAGALRTERDPQVRRALLFSYIMLGRQRGEGLDPDIAVQAFREIPPTSILWQYEPATAVAGMSIAGSPVRTDDYCWAIATRHPDTAVRIAVLSNALMWFASEGRWDLARRYYRELTGKYPESDESRYARRALNPDGNINAGKALPSFSIPSLDDSGEVISDHGMRGRIYLLDFWGTWCGPCIGMMGVLHTAYERFHGRGFEIVSIAFDDPEPVMEFRKGKWAMPWLHGVAADREFIDELEQRFEIQGVPRMILVDARGTILDVQCLHGEELLHTLERYLGGSGE